MKYFFKKINVIPIIILIITTIKNTVKFWPVLLIKLVVFSSSFILSRDESSKISVFMQISKKLGTKLIDKSSKESKNSNKFFGIIILIKIIKYNIDEKSIKVDTNLKFLVKANDKDPPITVLDTPFAA